MKNFQRRWMAAAALAIAFALLPASRAPADSGDEIRSFEGGIGWINSAPLTPEDLRGKVVLVDFWEYTCINCLHTLPYLREWYKRYHDKGLVIVGVHTPEFGFSGDLKNVADAVKRLDVTWPVVVDSNMNIWNRYDNKSWPHEYLYDQSGKLVDSVAGEGDYQQTEAKIQALLRRDNPTAAFPPVMALLPQDNYLTVGAVCYPQTPEILIDQTKIADADAFTDPSVDSSYRDPSNHRDGGIYLSGFWHATKQAVVSGGGGSAYLALRYHAVQVDVVMKTEDTGPIQVNVEQDGKPVERADAGSDIQYDASGMSFVTVNAPRAYALIMNAKFGHHELRLLPQHYGLGIYDLAFESCEVPAGTSPGGNSSVRAISSR